jgi:hypothetical protein
MAQNPATPIEDISIINASWKKGINFGRFG